MTIIAIIIVGLAFWFGLGWYSHVQEVRAQFWRYPNIWHKGDQVCWLPFEMVLGGMALSATWLVVGITWPRIPDDAAELVEPAKDRLQAGNEMLARLRGGK